MMLSPPSSKKLSSIPTRSTPSTSANSVHRISSCGVRGSTPQPRRRQSSSRQRTAVQLAVRRQRQTIQHHKRGRHHVVRQPTTTAQREAPPHPAPHQSPQPHSQPDAPGPARSSRATTAACATPASRNQRSLDLARLDPEPAQLHLRVRAAQELKHAVRTPPPQVPGPVHPAPSRTIRVRDKPLRRQTKPPQIAPRNTTTRNVKLARIHPQEQAPSPPSRT